MLSDGSKSTLALVKKNRFYNPWNPRNKHIYDIKNLTDSDVTKLERDERIISCNNFGCFKFTPEMYEIFKSEGLLDLEFQDLIDIIQNDTYLKSDIGRMHDTVEQLKRLLDESNTRYDTLSKDFKASSKNVSDTLESLNKSHSDSLKSVTMLLDEREITIREKDDIIQQVRQELREKQYEKTQLEEQLVELDDSNSKLMTQYYDLDKLHTEKLKEIEDNARELSKLRKEIDALNAQNKSHVETAIQAESEHLKHMEETTRSYDEKLETMLKKLEKLKDENKKILHEKSILTEKLKERDVFIDESVVKFEQFVNDLEKIEKREKKLVDENNSLKASLDKIKEEFDISESQNKELESQIIRLENLLDAMTKVKNELESTNDVLEKENFVLIEHLKEGLENNNVMSTSVNSILDVMTQHVEDYMGMTFSDIEESKVDFENLLKEKSGVEEVSAKFLEGYLAFINTIKELKNREENTKTRIVDAFKEFVESDTEISDVPFFKDFDEYKLGELKKLHSQVKTLRKLVSKTLREDTTIPVQIGEKLDRLDKEFGSLSDIYMTDEHTNVIEYMTDLMAIFNSFKEKKFSIQDYLKSIKELSMKISDRIPSIEYGLTSKEEMESIEKEIFIDSISEFETILEGSSELINSSASLVTNTFPKYTSKKIKKILNTKKYKLSTLVQIKLEAYKNLLEYLVKVKKITSDEFNEKYKVTSINSAVEELKKTSKVSEVGISKLNEIHTHIENIKEDLISALGNDIDWETEYYKQWLNLKVIDSNLEKILRENGLSEVDIEKIVSIDGKTIKEFKSYDARLVNILQEKYKIESDTAIQIYESVSTFE